MARWLSTMDLLRNPPRDLYEEQKTVPVRKSTVIQPKVAEGPPAPSQQKSSWTGSTPNEIPHSEPSLASRARPDLSDAASRVNAFSGAYHAKGARTVTTGKNKIRHKSGSGNVVLHGNLENGPGYIAKPHKGAAWGYTKSPSGGDIPDEHRADWSAGAEPHEWGRRHQAVYDVMSSMGAHHMVPVGIESKIHGHLSSGMAPDDQDSAAKAMRMPSSHAGGDAHVQEHIGAHDKAEFASPADLAKVSDEDRMHGIVMHTLFGHTDAHSGNVLVSKAGPNTHSVAIDHDSSMASAHSKQEAEQEGRHAVVSAYAPGGKLDYRANRSDDVGMNYPPRMKETLKRLAAGEHMAGSDQMNVSKEDAEFLKERAKMMLAHGLEGTLSQLSVRPGE